MYSIKADNRQIKLSDRVYESIRKMVSFFEIKPGEKIHIEELASKLDASVTPVREALNRLITQGLVLSCDGRGFKNREIDRVEIEELINLRKFITIGAFISLLDPKNYHLVGKVFDDSIYGELNAPYCARAISQLKNREVMKIYDTVFHKLFIFWKVYASTECGRENIEIYKFQLTKSLNEKNRASCISCIEENFSNQIRDLDGVIDQVIIEIFSKRNRDIYQPHISLPFP